MFDRIYRTALLWQQRRLDMAEISALKQFKAELQKRHVHPGHPPNFIP
jgi:hypothetical protein